ncbi:FadR/GntR family transcriptional regulator [Mesorhizobium sp. M0701]|uniref:FadR/GntR family transcriptional regulator n=1 Tax=Mesorhizobium sp. M0701 TaxID=2956989 RepID=UPI0033389BFF
MDHDNGNKSLHDRVVRVIGARIVRGNLKEGDKIDSDGTLAREFGASRTAMREAVRVLTDKGLVESRPRLGTRVRSSEHWNYLDVDILSWHQWSDDRQWVQDLLEMRRLIEPKAAAIAASRGSVETFARMRGALDTMASCAVSGSLEEAVFADIAFHKEILAATRNNMISSLHYAISASLRVTLTETKRDLLQSSLPAHYKVLSAIESRNPDAAYRAMEDLIQHAADDLLGQSSQ